MVEAPRIEPGARTLSVGSLYSGSAHRQARFGALTHPGRGQRRGQTARSIFSRANQSRPEPRELLGSAGRKRSGQ
jgi:hypothetical protein